MKKLSVLFCVSIALLAVALPGAWALRGELLATYNFYGRQLVMDPARHHLYATRYYDNSVAVIDTRTLSVVANVPVGSIPGRLALSPDAQRVYVTNWGGKSITTIDASTLLPLTTFGTPYSPWDIEAGPSGRLYVGAGESFHGIMMIDSNTGSFLGEAGGGLYQAVQVEISADRKTLYASERGISSPDLLKFDISAPTQQSLYRGEGAGGEGLVLSYGGDFLYNDYRKIRTSDMTQVSRLEPSMARMSTLALSPDDRLAYAVLDGKVDVFDTGTNLRVSTFAVAPASVSSMESVVDDTGRLLFISYWDSSSSGRKIRVYDTGVPEPASLLAVALGLTSLAGCMHRRRMT